MPDYYTVHPAAPWGDYGRVLAHGLARQTSEGAWAIERCGPFVPAVTMPRADLVVATNTLRQAAQASELLGLDFAPVIKAKIVRLDWHTWDATAQEPASYPRGGEPEAYVQAGIHDPETSSEVGELWRFSHSSWGTGAVQRTKGSRAQTFSLERGEGAGPDIFTASGLRTVFASARARAWLAAQAGKWLRFGEVKTT